MVSAILWSFEAREILAEQLEISFGSRLHCNFSVSVFVVADLSAFDSDFLLAGLALALVNGVAGIKVARSRMAGNLTLGWHTARSDVVSGVLVSSYGFLDVGFSLELALDEHLSVSPLATGARPCSLTRHLLRVRQLERCRIAGAVLRTSFSLAVFRALFRLRF